MSNLRNEAAVVQREIRIAAAAVSTLKRNAEKDIGNDMGHLYAAMESTCKTMKGMIELRKNRHWALSLIQTNTREATALQKSFSEIAASLETATECASQSHTTTKSYYLKALDLPNTHIKPARKSVQVLKCNIVAVKSRLRRELDSTRRIQAANRKEATRVSDEIAAKERSLNDSRKRLNAKSDEINRNRRRQETLQANQRARERRAAELREEAESRRTKGLVVAFMTLGIGSLYLAYQLDQAANDENQANNEEQEGRNLGYELTRLELAVATLQAETRELEVQSATLNLTKNRLQSDLDAQNQRVLSLEAQLQALNSEVTDASAVLAQADGLDRSIDPVSNVVNEIQHQMLDLKQKFDGLTAALDEKKDKAVFFDRKSKKLKLDEEGRNQLIGMLAEAYSDLQGQLDEVGKKWLQLTED